MINVLNKVCYAFPFQPIGIKAAAMLLTPLSVASRLNWAAAFLVSCISTLIPRELIYFLVSGEIGYVEAPRPRIRRSRSWSNLSTQPTSLKPQST